MSTLRAIHAICRKNGVDETARRAIYKHVTGKTSAGDMSETERKSVVAHMNQKFGGNRKTPLSEKRYVRLIFALWKSCADCGAIESGARAACVAFVKRETGVDDPNWLTYAQASPVIEALKAIERRAKKPAGR